MALWVYDRFPLDLTKYIPIAIERTFQIRYYSLPRPLRARLDLVLFNPETNGLYIVDHKTTDMDPRQKAAVFPFSIQLRMYALILAAIVEKHPYLLPLPARTATPLGMIHNIIRTPTIRQKRTEEFSEYVDRVYSDYDTKLSEFRQATNVGATDIKPPFLRSSLSFSGPIMSEETLLTLREVSAASNCRLDLSRFPCSPDGSACFKWNRPCPFLPLCQANKEAWGPIIKSDYVVHCREEEEEKEEDFLKLGPAEPTVLNPNARGIIDHAKAHGTITRADVDAINMGDREHRVELGGMRTKRPKP